jgi:hypothetical protein
MLSDVPADDAPADDTDSLPTLEDCADDYDDDEGECPFQLRGILLFPRPRS